MTVWENFVTNQVPIKSRLSPLRVKLVQDNREYFIVLSEYIRYFCVQKFSYRHKDENESEAEKRGKTTSGKLSMDNKCSLHCSSSKFSIGGVVSKVIPGTINVLK